MTYRGHIKGGVIIPDRPIDLPEGTEVEIAKVEPVDEEILRLRAGLLKFAGIIKDGPPDMARNHDHYIHGTPKHD
jgi:predicted DNA-binding antitoxin AbrB/MazE fold protein